MNSKHLGDAIDHWKGSVLQRLGGSLRNLRVLPMFTDPDPWTEEHLSVYAELLRVRRDRILCSDRRFLNATRDQYFANLRLAPDWDLFVDPDIGVASACMRDVKHICPCELAELLPAHGGRVVLVYQHARRKRDETSGRLPEIIATDALRGCSAFAYDAGSVAMVILSRERTRLHTLRELLIRLLGGCSRVSQICSALPSAE